MPTAGRRDELTRLRAHLLERRPAVLTGPVGIGRSHLLRALAEHLVSAGVDHHLVHGADGEGGVPLGPFAHLLEAHDALGPERTTLEVYTRLPALLVADGTVLLVDDAHLLDRASQVLLAQLGRAGLPLIVSTPELDDLPKAIQDEVGGARGWTVERLTPLGTDDVLSLATDQLGDSPDATSAAFLLQHSGGVPLVAHELLAACADGSSSGPAGVTLGPLQVTDRLARVVDRRLGPLDEDAGRALQLLSVAGPLPADALPAADVEWLLLRGLARPVDPDAIELAEPLVGSVLRDRTSPRERLVLLRSAAGLLAGRPGWAETSVRLRADLGEPPPDDQLLASAERAVASGRYDDALGLLGAGSDRLLTDPLALLLRGAALSSAGDLDAAYLALDAAAGAGDPSLRARAGQELGLLLAVRTEDPARAVTRVGEVAAGLVEHPALRRLLEGDLVKWRLMAGLPSEPVPGVPDPSDAVGRVNDALIGAMISSLDGDPEQARATVGAGFAALEETDAVPAWTGDLLRLSTYLADAFDGRLVQAEELARQHRERAALTADPSLGMWEYATAELALHSGRPRRAWVLAGRALRHLAWQDFTGLRPAAVALRAAAAARTARPQVALEVVHELDDAALADVKVDLHVARVRAEQLLSEGRPGEAADELVRVGTLAVAQSHRHLGLLALDEAVLADPDGARDRVALLAEHVLPEAGLGPALLRRAHALVDKDADALVASADELAALGLPGRAAQALSTARVLHERRGRGERARRAHLRQLMLLSDQQASVWPDAVPPALLSPRELEVARFAAARLRSREIADRCGLSVRTVDNHLARVYRKLGVTGRDDLSEALAALGRDPRPTPAETGLLG